MAIYRKKKFTSPKKVGEPEIGAAHKSQKVGRPGGAPPPMLLELPDASTLFSFLCQPKRDTARICC